MTGKKWKKHYLVRLKRKAVWLGNHCYVGIDPWGGRRFVMDDARISHRKLYPFHDRACDLRGNRHLVLAAGISVGAK